MATPTTSTGNKKGGSRAGSVNIKSVAFGVVVSAIFILVWWSKGAPSEGTYRDLVIEFLPFLVFGVSAIFGTALGFLARQILTSRFWRSVREGHGWRRWAIPLAVVAVGIVVVIFAASVLIQPAPETCGEQVQLRVLTSPSQLAATEELADAYELWTATENDGCPSVRPYVFATATDKAIGALTTGWTSVNETAPRPDVWFAEAATDVEHVRDEIKGPDIELVALEYQRIASSPLVLAVAGSELTGDGNEARYDRTWARLIAAVEERKLGLVRPHPQVSHVGATAVTALYGSGEELTDFARRVEQRIEEQAKDGYRPLADTNELLSHYRERGDPKTALIVTEQAMVRSNLDDSRNVACRESVINAGRPADGEPADDGSSPDPLVALYPTDTLTVDHVVAALAWRHQPRQARAAAGFLSWLRADGRASLAAVGLRPRDLDLNDDATALGTPLSTDACGALPDALGGDPSRSPSFRAAERAENVYTAAQRPGRVLLALDLSGSMDSDAPGGAVTRHEVATDAIEGAVQRLGDKDELGLWVFQNDDWRQLVPIGEGEEEYQGRPRDEAVVRALVDLAPEGATPLYKTIHSGVAAVGGNEDLVTGLVVVTDGEDTSGDPEDKAAVEKLDEEVGVPVFVVAVGEASCRIDTIIAVTENTGGDCIDADFGTLDSQLNDLFGVLWSGTQG